MKIILLITTIGLITLILMTTNIDPACHTLMIEAPETMRAPIASEFTTEKHYIKAQARFEEHGTWAMDDGHSYNCK